MEQVGDRFPPRASLIKIKLFTFGPWLLSSLFPSRRDCEDLCPSTTQSMSPESVLKSSVRSPYSCSVGELKEDVPGGGPLVPPPRPGLLVETRQKENRVTTCRRNLLVSSADTTKGLDPESSGPKFRSEVVNGRHCNSQE